jgi:shikimate dehydrogenase
MPLADAPRVKADILVNATSVGMTPGDQHSPLPAACCKNFRVVMDIVYAPLQTRLLREAAAAGCSCINGLEMLLYQGVAQFELWTGCTAPVAVMRQALHQELDSRTENH